MALMRDRGFQEEGEAAGKWRRALLTSTQLSTYFVGYTESQRSPRPGRPGFPPRSWHDEMLAHGSPAPRHLQTLLTGPQDPPRRPPVVKPPAAPREGWGCLNTSGHRWPGRRSYRCVDELYRTDNAPRRGVDRDDGSLRTSESRSATCAPRSMASHTTPSPSSAEPFATLCRWSFPRSSAPPENSAGPETGRAGSSGFSEGPQHASPRPVLGHQDTGN